MGTEGKGNSRAAQVTMARCEQMLVYQLRTATPDEPELEMEF